MRSEKETLESVVNEKTTDASKVLTNENSKVEAEIKRHYNHQRDENIRL